MPKVHPYAVVFPRFVPDLIQAANSVAPLRHSIISLASVVADTSLNRPLVRALLHHQVTLEKLQCLLSIGGTGETTIYAVMMLAYFNLFSGRFLSARRHLEGVRLLLESFSAMGESPSATTMLIWRCAVRLDYFLASVYPCKPIFPTPPPEQEEFHRVWICTTATSTGQEWALAQFALDNLQSRAAHLSWDAYQSRREQGTRESEEDEIHESCVALLNDFAKWRCRKVFLEEDAKEEFLENINHPSATAAKVETFLHYEPMKCQNPFYANLLNEYRCAVMFVTFIASPQIGYPSLFDTVRKLHAIDSCRSISATGVQKFPIPMVRVLQLAGLVFSDSRQFREECGWIEQQLDRIAKRGVQAAGRVKEMLGIVWNSSHPWSYEDTELAMQNADDLELESIW